MGTMKILVLHGWTYAKEEFDPLKKWDPFIDQMIEKKHRPVLLRVPGLTRDLKEIWNLEKYVEWLKKEVDKEKERVVLIGHSNGGRISLAFAHKYPQKVEKMILIDSAGVYHNGLPTRIKKFVFRYVAKVGKKFSNSEKMKILLYKLAREGDYKNATPEQRQTMISLINTDLTPIMSQLKIPTLIVWGENDKVTPLSDGILMNKLIENSKLKIIKGARHSPQFTHSKEVVKEIHEYL